MKLERRRARRERPKHLSYIHFEPEGGGIVVNASEQGLAFQAATALRHSGPIQLCVSPNPMEQIRLTAEVAWMDAQKKSGGLRLTELTADAKNQILRWLTQDSDTEAPSGPFKVPSRAFSEEVDSRFRPSSETPDQLSPVPDSAMPTGSDSAIPDTLRAANIPALAFRLAPFSPKGQTLIPRRRSPHALATAFLILVFAFTAIFSLQSFRREIGSSLIRVGESLNGSRDAQPHASSAIPSRTFNPNPLSTPSTPNPLPGVPGKETPAEESPARETPDSSAAASAQGIEETEDSRLVDHQNARTKVADARARRGRSALARELWSALARGDSSAEAPLAQLYLAGDGVPRNCDQARVLLRAAGKNGDIEALKQLRQLNKSACGSAGIISQTFDVRNPH